MVERFYKLPQAIAARKDLSATAKLVYAAILNRLGKNSTSWPGIRRLAGDCGTSTGAIRRAIELLERSGLLAIERGHQRKANRYTPVSYVSETNTKPEEGLMCPKRTQGVSEMDTKLASYVSETDTEKITTDSLKDKVCASAPHDALRKKTKTPKAPPDPRVKTFIDWFADAYLQATGQKYVVAGGKEGALVKRLLASLSGNGVDTLEELQRAARTMMADDWGKDRADIGLLSAKINSWLKPTAAATGDSYAEAIQRMKLYDELSQKHERKHEQKHERKVTT